MFLHQNIHYYKIYCVMLLENAILVYYMMIIWLE